MPLNRILWLLTGISGDGVRRPFLALPVAPFSPLCPAFGPLPAAASWRWCGRFPAVSLIKRRGGVLSCSGRFSFLGSCDWFGVVVAVCLMGVVGGSSCLPLSVRASPAPWGGGLYEAGGRRSRSAVRGSGCRCDFPCLVCLSSCHLVVPRRHCPLLLLASLCPPLVAIASPCPCLLRSVAPVSSRLVSRPVLVACVPHRSCVSSRLVLSCHRLIVSLPVPSTSGAGRCLLACLSCRRGSSVIRHPSPCAPAFPLVPSVFPCLPRILSPSRLVRSPLSSSSCVPCLPRGSWLVAVSPRAVSSLSVLVLACCLCSLVSPLSFSPLFDKHWRGVWRLICLLAVFSSFVSVRRGASRGVGGGLLGVGVVRAVSAGVLVLVVFGLWCRCLYIQIGCLLVYDGYCRKGKTS